MADDKIIDMGIEILHNEPKTYSLENIVKKLANEQLLAILENRTKELLSEEIASLGLKPTFMQVCIEGFPTQRNIERFVKHLNKFAEKGIIRYGTLGSVVLYSLARVSPVSRFLFHFITYTKLEFVDLQDATIDEDANTEQHLNRFKRCYAVREGELGNIVYSGLNQSIFSQFNLDEYNTLPVDEEDLRIELLELRKDVGQLPEGVNPLELKPRASTWLKERENWQAEVKQLQEHNKHLEAVIVKALQRVPEYQDGLDEVDSQVIIQHFAKQLIGLNRAIDAYWNAHDKDHLIKEIEEQQKLSKLLLDIHGLTNLI